MHRKWKTYIACLILIRKEDLEACLEVSKVRIWPGKSSLAWDGKCEGK